MVYNSKQILQRKAATSKLTTNFFLLRGQAALTYQLVKVKELYMSSLEGIRILTKTNTLTLQETDYYTSNETCYFTGTSDIHYVIF